MIPKLMCLSAQPCQGSWRQQPHWWYTDLSGQLPRIPVRASGVGVAMEEIRNVVTLRFGVEYAHNRKGLGFF